MISSGGVSRRVKEGFADIVLEAAPGTPSVVIEAKREHRTAEDAMQQAIRYAQQLDVPLAYGANGKILLERNLRTGTERRVHDVVSPEGAWVEYCEYHGLSEESARLIAQPFNRRRRSVAGDVITPRWYQTRAVNAVLRAIGQGRRRVLLLMATGTGKTFTAMQIVAKLREYEQVVHPDRNYRVLYLADRDWLLSQPMNKDFSAAFGQKLLHRVKGGLTASREIYFASYQAMTGNNPDAPVELPDDAPIFSGFRPDFFDLVIVDECHRGSAAADSSWRRVLEYFSSAVQLGLTATPRDDTVNSYEYFGNPVFTYSLKQGIEDGYLAPYTVRRVVLSPDADGWRPTSEQLDRYGHQIPEGMYSTRDFERVVSLLARTRLAAHRLSQTLRKNPRARTIVFCVDTEHANDMRQALIEENPDLVRADPNWVVRIVGIEGEKEQLLSEFTDPEGVSPVVATTSRLLSTGVDVEDLRYVVLFRPVGSMIEFKQIIGRGTRLYPPKGKTSFEILDFVGATSHFSEPDFDGYPADITVETVDDEGEVTGTQCVDPLTGDVLNTDDDADPQVAEPEPPFTVTTPDPESPSVDIDLPTLRRKYYVDDGSFRLVAEAHLVPIQTDHGLQLTDYGQVVRDRLRQVGSADDIRRKWASASTRHELIAALGEHDIDLGELVELAGGADLEPLDALVHLAWNLPVRTRAEHARGVRRAHAEELESMSRAARQVLEGLLQRYEAYGVSDIESPDVFRLDPLRGIGSPAELAEQMGGADRLRGQLDLVQEWLYA